MPAIQTIPIACHRAHPKPDPLNTETPMSLEALFIPTVLVIMGLFAATLGAVAIISRE